MIVVIGDPSTGLASRVAVAAAERGRTVQLVGRIADGAAADAVLQDLARRAVGHVAILRDASVQTLQLDGADVELALRYLTDFDVLVVVDAGGSILPVAERAATWGGASLVVVGDTGPGGPPGLMPADGESADVFGDRVGAMAAGLDERVAAVRAAR